MLKLGLEAYWHHFPLLHGKTDNHGESRSWQNINY
jgi:hypothetical protein